MQSWHFPGLKIETWGTRRPYRDERVFGSDRAAALIGPCRVPILESFFDSRVGGDEELLFALQT
jgi:hypothetical protein